MQMPLAFLVGVPGGGELLLIFVAVLLMFGPKKLPEIARNIGKAMEYLRQTSQEFRDQVMRIDEEATKTIEAAVSDKPATTELQNQNELPLGVSEQPASEEPYQNPEESYQNPEEQYQDPEGNVGADSSGPAPGGEEQSTAEGDVKLDGKNVAENDSNIQGVQESPGESEPKDADKSDGLAG